MTATWTKGVPIVPAGTKPILRFKKSSTGRRLLNGDSQSGEFERRSLAAANPLQGEVYFAALSVTLTNDLNVGGSSGSLSCSFAGGCLYEVQA